MIGLWRFRARCLWLRLTKGRVAEREFRFREFVRMRTEMEYRAWAPLLRELGLLSTEGAPPPADTEPRSPM